MKVDEAGLPATLVSQGLSARPLDILLTQALGKTPALMVLLRSWQLEIMAKPTTTYIYSNSRLMYWWPVWLWGGVCAAITYFRHIDANLPNGTQVSLSSDLGVGASYISVVVAVLFITNNQVRGWVAKLVAALFFGAVFSLVYFDAWAAVVTALPFLGVHMSMGFYVCSSTAVFLLWFFAVFVSNRVKYWSFDGSAVIEHDSATAGSVSYYLRGAVLTEKPGDFLLHQVLGLGFLRFGTADIDLRFSNGRRITVDNLWRASTRIQDIRNSLSRLPPPPSAGEGATNIDEEEMHDD